MDRQAVVDILNELLRAEQTSLIHRLLESMVFVGWASANQYAQVQQLAQEVQEHQAWLADAIFQLHGSVAPERPDLTLADLNYVELNYVLPRVLANENKIIARYEAASARLAGDSIAAETVNRILTRHRDHVTRLTQYQFIPPAEQRLDDTPGAALPPC